VGHSSGWETRDRRITILIDRVSILSDQETRVLHELNTTLHNAEVVPSDIGARRVRARHGVQSGDQTERN
jgi:hypothetical protein